MQQHNAILTRFVTKFKCARAYTSYVLIQGVKKYILYQYDIMVNIYLKSNPSYAIIRILHADC